MVMTDPLADMLTRIRNGSHAKHDKVEMPSSKIKAEVAKILREEGFIKAYRVVEDEKQGVLKIYLRYRDGGEPTITGIRRLSRPGLRRYVGWDEIPKVLGGMGVAILTTSKGLMTGKRAVEQRLGGELLAEIW
jgi:small subunit ribosomal protein S8